VIILFALSCLPAIAVAQDEETLKRRIVGTWIPDIEKTIGFAKENLENHTESQSQVIRKSLAGLELDFSAENEITVRVRRGAEPYIVQGTFEITDVHVESATVRIDIEIEGIDFGRQNGENAAAFTFDGESAVRMEVDNQSVFFQRAYPDALKSQVVGKWVPDVEKTMEGAREQFGDNPTSPEGKAHFEMVKERLGHVQVEFTADGKLFLRMPAVADMPERPGSYSIKDVDLAADTLIIELRWEDEEPDNSSDNTGRITFIDADSLQMASSKLGSFYFTRLKETDTESADGQKDRDDQY
jgi:hypothetical protein